MPPDPALSIVVVNWNTRDLLARCLQSIESQLPLRAPAAPPRVATPSAELPPSNLEPRTPSFEPRTSNFELYVVDNASSDGSAGLVRERFPWVRLMENTENVGFAAANNQALRRAKARYALLLNSDAILLPGSLNALLAFASGHPRAGIVGVRLVNPDGSFQAAWNDFPTWYSAILEAWGPAKRLSGNPYYPSYPPERSMTPTPCDWVGGACLLARAAAIDQVGLLDEQFFMYSEEMDWCYRMWQQGWEVWYTPDVQVVHCGGASADRMSAAQRMRLYASKAHFIRKHNGAFAASVVRLNYRLSSLLKALAYQMRFLLVRDEVLYHRARSHWQVAVTGSWS